LGIAKHKIIKRYNKAKETNDEEKLFLIESEIKEFQGTEISLMTSFVPYILLAGIIYIMVVASKKGTLSGIPLIFCILAVLFLSFVGIALSCIFISKLRLRNKKAEKLQGVLKEIVLATYLESDNNIVKMENYRLRITYKTSEEEYELLTEEVFSESQIEVLKQLEYIPLIKRGDIVKVDQSKVFSARRKLYISDVEILKGKVASSGYNKKKDDDSEQYLTKLDEDFSKIEERQGLQKQVNVVLCVFISVFCVLFAICGLVAILDRVYWGIIFIVASVIFFYLGVVKSIVRIKQYNKVLALGEKGFALNYRLISHGGDSSNIAYGIEFSYTDANGCQRIAHEGDLKVSIFYFQSYQIEKLPIKVYDKYAILDYEELLKYQNPQN